MRVRHAIGLVPLAPIAAACAIAGAGTVIRDLYARARREFDAVWDQLEADAARWSR